MKRNGLSFDIPTQGEPIAPAVAAKPKREPKVKAKNDPRLVAAARELRDRWLEQVNATPLIGQGKYDVSRRISETASVRQLEPMQLPLLIEQSIAA